MIWRSDQPGKHRSSPGRTLSVRTECYSRHERRHRILELSSKPKDLPDGPVDQRTWHQYQAYLSRIRPIARADFYRRLMDSRGLKSIRALAKEVGEDWSRVARVLKLLELPKPVLEYLRTHGSPAIVEHFTESRLRELLTRKDPRRIWTRFQEMLRELETGN